MAESPKKEEMDVKKQAKVLRAALKEERKKTEQLTGDVKALREKLARLEEYNNEIVSSQSNVQNARNLKLYQESKELRDQLEQAALGQKTPTKSKDSAKELPKEPAKEQSTQVAEELAKSQAEVDKLKATVQSLTKQLEDEKGLTAELKSSLSTFQEAYSKMEEEHKAKEDKSAEEHKALAQELSEQKAKSEGYLQETKSAQERFMQEAYTQRA